MSNPVPQVGDIWKFHGLGRDFYYLIVEYTAEDPERYDADSVTLLSFTVGEKQYTKELASKMCFDTRIWSYVA